MNKPIFYMMMGLPCSGKSTFAQKLAEEYNANIHSSDAIREELIGDINNQEHNNEVFHTLHKRIKDDLIALMNSATGDANILNENDWDEFYSKYSAYITSTPKPLQLNA